MGTPRWHNQGRLRWGASPLGVMSLGAHYVQGGDLGRARWHKAGSGHGDSRDQGVFGGRGCCGGSVPPCVPSPGPYRTRPLVFLSTEAAKLCVTPTRLVPSTSTIRSFTWILGTRGRSWRCHPLPTSPASPSSPQNPRGCSSRSLGEGFGAGHPLPAVPVGCTPFRHRLDEDAQLLQAHVGPRSHANDADPQPLGVCGDREPCPRGWQRWLPDTDGVTLDPSPRLWGAGRGQDPPFSSSTGKRSRRSTLFSSSYSADAAMGSTSSLRRS